MAAQRKKNIDEATDKPVASRLRKTIYLLPNMVTAANMVLGIWSITWGINDSLTLSLFPGTNTIPFVWPARLIVIAAFLDLFDGMVARATHTTSKFGQEFDSLSDLISFGMAPAILIYLSVLRYMGGWGLSITFLYVVCTAIRLARFNVQAQVEEKTSFMGLPSPGAAGILTSYVLLSRWSGFYDKGVFMNKVMGWYEENLNAIELYGVPILTVIIALVMVSTIPYPSLKKLNREFIKPWTLAFIGLVLIALVNSFEFSAFTLLTIYLFWGIIKFFTKKSLGRLSKPAKANPKI
jgi:CDP-diacylglycerol---serine O-phosphatidyltransferase